MPAGMAGKVRGGRQWIGYPAGANMCFLCHRWIAANALCRIAPIRTDLTITTGITHAVCALELALD